MTITNADTISCENVLPASENIIADRQNFLVHQRLETADLNHSLYSSSPMCEFSVFFFLSFSLKPSFLSSPLMHILPISTSSFMRFIGLKILVGFWLNFVNYIQLFYRIGYDFFVGLILW